jgi:ubiquinone/menaquinone biosynthesis C-methylase UbiE
MGSPNKSSSQGATRIVEMVMGYRSAKILLVGANMGVFDLLAKDRQGLPVLCRSLRTNPRATEILLDALVSLGFLKKQGRTYGNTPLSDRYLVEGRPEYLGNNLNYQEILWEAWSCLGQVVRRGHADCSRLNYWFSQHKTFPREYILAMHNIAEKPAAELAQVVSLPEAKTLLDVGAGSGTFSLALLKANPNLKATLLDLPSTLRIARDLVARHPLGSRVNYVSGNYKKVSFGHALYDVILMSHITHNEGEKVNRQLMGKARQALRPGGKLIIHDFMVDATKTTPLFGALFSVHMLVYTQEGRTYSRAEYEVSLRQAGFINVRHHPICKGVPNGSSVMEATVSSS